MVLVPPATSRLLAPPAQSLGRSGSGLGVSSFHGWGLPTPPDLVILIWEREEKSQVQSAVLPTDFSLTPQLWFSLCQFLAVLAALPLFFWFPLQLHFSISLNVPHHPFKQIMSTFSH